MCVHACAQGVAATAAAAAAGIVGVGGVVGDVVDRVAVLVCRGRRRRALIVAVATVVGVLSLYGREVEAETAAQGRGGVRLHTGGDIVRAVVVVAHHRPHRLCGVIRPINYSTGTLAQDVMNTAPPLL